MTDRTSILQRILNLRELADSSTSQSEAMNAMKIADKLMQGYRVEEAELALAEGLGEIKVEVVDETRWDLGLKVGRIRHKVQACIWNIESYCEVECVLRASKGIRVFGDKPDVEMFWWLLEHVRKSMDVSYELWKRNQQGIGRGAKASYQLAFGSAVNSRLSEMKRERQFARHEAEQEAAKLLNVDESVIRTAVNNGDLDMIRSSMSLVVASASEQKQKQVQAAYQNAYNNVPLGTASGFGFRGGGTAAVAGRQAGNRVGLGRPIECSMH